MGMCVSIKHTHESSAIDVVEEQTAVVVMVVVVVVGVLAIAVIRE